MSNALAEEIVKILQQIHTDVFVSAVCLGLILFFKVIYKMNGKK